MSKQNEPAQSPEDPAVNQDIELDKLPWLQ